MGEKAVTEKLIRNFFAAADSLDADRFCSQLSEAVVWRFANFPVANGIHEVRTQYDMIVSIAESMHHEIVGIWQDGNCVTAETRVHYKDRYGRNFSFPGCDIIFLDGETIREVRIFVDNHELFVPPATDEGATS